MIAIQKGKYIWLVLLLLVVGSNIVLYNTALFQTLQIDQHPQVVIGSLLDLIIVAPILALLYIRKFSWKTTIAMIAAGCVVSRFVIPSTMLSPYKLVTTTGIAVELMIIAVELSLILIFLAYMPKIVRYVKASTEPVLFAFPQAVENVTHNPIVRVLASEMLIFYYAFASWRAAERPGITLYKNTSYVAFQIMIIHAIVLESLGLHWWLHSKAPVLSLILLIVNVYGVVFLVADMRATKLNPIQLEATGFFMSLGIMKRTYIDYRDIEQVMTEPVKSKRCVEFMTNDFMTPEPQIILKMKRPQTVHMLYGFKKEYDYVAIAGDDAAALRLAIERGVGE